MSKFFKIYYNKLKGEFMKKNKRKILLIVPIVMLLFSVTLFASILIMKWNGEDVIQTSKTFITELSDKLIKEKNENEKLQQENENLKKENEDLKNQNTGSSDSSSNPSWDQYNKLQQQYYSMVEEVRKANHSADDLRMHMNTIKQNLEIAGINIETEIQQDAVSTDMVEINY